MRKRTVALVSVALAAPAVAEAHPTPVTDKPKTNEYKLHRHAEQSQQIQRAQAGWRMHLKVLYWRRRHRRLVAAQAAATAPPSAVAPAPTSTTGGFPATCVANAEESGHNSVAGYFGFIYPPSSYGYGGDQNWLDWSWGAQLRVALSLYARYGGSAWGPRTRELCGI